MNKKANGELDTNDLVTAGFNRLDKDFSQRPPKIKWGKLYGKKTDHQKIEYLEKLAATMNHAAFVISEERNKFGRLAETKERQIKQAQAALNANNAMIQSEITKMNADRQSYAAEIKKLRDRIRELNNGNLD